MICWTIEGVAGMYLSAERLAVANQAVKETFEQTSVAWRAIPQWDTGDPSQTRVRNDDLTTPGFVSIISVPIEFDVTLAEAMGPSPDAVLAKVLARTVKLAARVDAMVIPELRKKGKPDLELDDSKSQLILDTLIDARARVEKFGYRAPSCLITDTAGIKKLSQLDGGYSILSQLLGPANINSLHRAEALEDPVPTKKKARAILLGRRQRIADGGAGEASCGEEPVDLAVSVLPSLEVVGDTADNKIALTVRISYALRIKDSDGLVVIADKA
jgi:hypothetical protein